MLSFVLFLEGESRLEDPKQLVTRLYQDYAKDVLRVSYFYIGNREKAEDIMQEVFIKVLKKPPTLEEGKEKSWLLKVALNLCRDYWRSSWAKRVLLGTKALELAADEFSMDDRDEKAALLQAINRLSPPYKEVILLFYYQNLSLKEIADVLGQPEGTVASKISRARSQLKKMLEGSVDFE